MVMKPQGAVTVAILVEFPFSLVFCAYSSYMFTCLQYVLEIVGVMNGFSSISELKNKKIIPVILWNVL